MVRTDEQLVGLQESSALEQRAKLGDMQHLHEQEQVEQQHVRSVLSCCAHIVLCIVLCTL
jgi:hypothetical protein